MNFGGRADGSEGWIKFEDLDCGWSVLVKAGSKGGLANGIFFRTWKNFFPVAPGSGLMLGLCLLVLLVSVA